MQRSLVSTSPLTARKATGLVGSVVAGVAALALAFGAPAAHAAMFHVSSGHADISRVSIDPASNRLVMGLNHEAAGAYCTAGSVAASPTQEPVVDVVVTDREGSGWVIKDRDANPSKLLAGFAASGTEVPDAEAANGAVGVDGYLAEGDHVAFSVVPMAGNPGTVNLAFDPAQQVVSSGTTHTAVVEHATEPEALHVHPKWTFSAAGTYYITITASNPEGKVGASAPLTYKFVVR